MAKQKPRKTVNQPRPRSLKATPGVSKASSVVSKVKGRPMLYWVGKQPLARVSHYPAQLAEVWNGTKPLSIPSWDALKKDWRNLLLHGDNKEVLSMLLVQGFRGKIDLIYIDPPFDSGADYVRKVELRGDKTKIEGVDQSLAEQTQYTDIWKNDTYLQFMYERLQLLRELLSDKGAIYLHCDWHKSHQLRFLLDEVFGTENFVNEISWSYRSGGASRKESLSRKHDTIFLYKKTSDFFIRSLTERQYLEKSFMDSKQDKEGRFYVDTILRDTFEGVINVVEKDGSLHSYNTRPVLNLSAERVDYPTQKPQGLLELLLRIASDGNDTVLDCFSGSGTTMAAAQRLGRRWVGADINRGAIQVSLKRLAQIVVGQRDAEAAGEKVFENKNTKFYEGILSYKVNNYDFQREEAWRAVAVQKYGIELTPADGYFDGVLGERLVKFVSMNRPIARIDAEEVLKEMRRREDDPRNMVLVGSGAEAGLDAFIAEKNRLSPINRLEYKDLMRDGIHAFAPAEAKVDVHKKGKKANIIIHSYVSPTILARMDIDRSVFGERIKDFRAQIDTVMIDTDYNGREFHVRYSDIPEKKQDLVRGTYELEIPKSGAKVAVKITDMLGEEFLFVA